MRHLIALFIKFIMVTIILSLVLGIMTDLSLGSILYISVAVTVLNYVIGDLLIYAAANKIIAIIADFIITLAAVYLYNDLVNLKVISLWDALISSILICVGEWYFHKYIVLKVLSDEEIDK